MPESERDPGWKASRRAVALLILGALALSALTCWLLKINPLPTTGHALDSGWFVTLAFIYFFVLYLVVERLKRGR
jgi:polyferredoxin